MGPNTKILTKRDRALICTPFDLSRKNKQFKIKKVKNDRVMPINVVTKLQYLLKRENVNGKHWAAVACQR